MNFKRALALAFAVAALLPAAAAADTVPPGSGDNYLRPIFLNDQSSPLPRGIPVGFQADTTNYTTQPDMYNPPSSGGPPEPLQCGSSTYSHTIWSVFYSNRYGLAKISTAGNFDSVIAVIPFGNPQTDTRPQLSNGQCIDNLSGFEEDLQGIVVPNQWYAIQVGGTGNPQGGSIQLKLEIDDPPTVNGDAILSWNSASGGAIVKSLVVSGGPGERIAVDCTHHGCPSKKFNSAGLRARIGAVGPGSSLFRPIVHAAAKKYKLLKGRKVKAGSTIEVRITEPGFIGQYFGWKVKKNGVGTKIQRCMNPGSTKPRKKCP